MTTPNGAERFLQLENSASELLEELEQLNQESKHYSEAATSLESVESSVKGLTESLTNISQQLEGIIAGLRDIGLPAVLDRTANLETEIASARTELQSSSSKLETGLASIRAEIKSIQQSSTKQESELANARTEIKLIQQSSTETVTALEDLGLNLGDKIDESQSSLISRLDSLIRFHSGPVFSKLFGKPDYK